MVILYTIHFCPQKHTGIYCQLNYLTVIKSKSFKMKNSVLVWKQQNLGSW